MRHFASPAFWEAYARLPDNIRTLADKNFAVLKQDPRHPPRCISKRSADSGRPVSGCAIAR